MIYQVHQVFGTHMPELTEIDRSETAAYSEIRDALRQPGWMARFVGPSKSGKSVLCKQIARSEGFNPIYITKPETVDDFWVSIAHSAGEALAHIPDDPGKRHVLDIVNYCKKTARPLVIEDFHGVSVQVRRAILMRMKEFIDAAIPILIIAVTDVAGSLITTDRNLIRDIDGRTGKINAPGWDRQLLGKIGTIGFPALGVEVSSAVIDELAFHAYRNPLLMQRYCLSICRKYKINQTLVPPQSLEIDAEILLNIFLDVARGDNQKFNSIWMDKRAKKFRLKSGREMNLAGLILLSIAKVALVSPVKIDNLERRVRRLLDSDEEKPSAADVAEAIKEFTKKAKNKLGSDASVDIIDGLLYILDPFFKVYLLWYLMPTYTGEYPEIEAYLQNDVDQLIDDDQDS